MVTAMKSTVISGTERNSSMKAMAETRITGMCDRLASASATPPGRAVTIARTEMSRVRKRPPQRLVFTSLTDQFPSHR